MGYMYSLYTTRKVNHELCKQSKHPPPHHLRQVFKVIMNSEKTSKYWNHLQKRWVGFQTILLYYHLIQDCVIHPCCRLPITLKAFCWAKKNCFHKRATMASHLSLKYCLQYFTNVQRTNSLFFVILSLVRFSSAFTFSSFPWRASRELWQRSFCLSWRSKDFFCFSRSSLLLSSPAFFKASLICFSNSSPASLVTPFSKGAATSWSII